MDTKDVSEDDRLLVMMKRLEDAANKAMQKKGQLVQDHPPRPDVINAFMMKLVAKSFLPPTTSITMPITQVPAPYPLSIVPLQDLEPIPISQMRLETHHRGKKVLLHVLTPPDRITAVMVIVEDEEETAVLLQLYQQPEEEIDPLLERFLHYSVCIVKEPFFKQSVDGPYSLRVDHPSDIIWLDETDERIPQKWRESKLTLDNGSEIIRIRGNEFVKKQRWTGVLHSYSHAIQTAQTPEDEQLAYLNRSLVNLRLDRPARAWIDATQGYGRTAPSEKSLFRQARALYQLGNFEKSRDKLRILSESFPNSQTGEYSFTDMYEQAKATPPLIDCATFSSLVEIRDSPGRGRGLFTKKPVSAGDILLCEKAFAYYFVDEDKPGARATVLMNMSTKKITMGGTAHLLPHIAQKLYHNPECLPVFQDLYCGDYEKLEVSECDGNPVVDSFLVEKIISLNAFGAPRSCLDFSRDRMFHGQDPTMSRQESMFSTSGIWLIASRINHSCIGNCRRSMIGDMQIVRAATDLPAGAELFFYYRPPNPLESYQDVQKQLKGWGFVCQCELCKARKKTSQTVLQRRTELYNDLKSDLARESEPFDFAKANRLLKAVEKTYHGKSASKIRLELIELYLAVGDRYKASDQMAENVKMIVKALEAMGFTMVACPPDKITNRPQLEVKRWGYADDAIPWLFLKLLEAYQYLAPELCQTARLLAERSYSMVIGEKDSMYDLHAWGFKT
ncbi:hypothetical protein FSARC_437 [Fusarium sarcochroum]|uniref:SET domain-containing protein n=1 Tax=Fusarium sarcochroum TaxID=1208366 RepID=A0A8H4UB59_9HYPO|nr:hypothetical protein FSARC_437 [Fusarium sarcochroum]